MLLLSSQQLLVTMQSLIPPLEIRQSKETKTSMTKEVSLSLFYHKGSRNITGK